jgi:DMSO reductase anchor subunit
VQALPQAAFFLLLEASVGGTIALFWVHLRGEVPRGFTLFTGACLLVLGALAIWLRSAFPPDLTSADLATGRLWFSVERVTSIAFVLLLAAHLLTLRRSASPVGIPILGPAVPLVGLISLWSAALISPGGQLGGLGVPLADLAGAMALGAALTGLSLGHWYLVSPTMSVQPLIRLTFLCIGALVCQSLLLLALLFSPGVDTQALLSNYSLFVGVRVLFGLAVPLVACVMTWRTARIRSLDSATGLLYIVAALILAGEIAARSLFFLTGVAT